MYMSTLFHLQLSSISKMELSGGADADIQSSAQDPIMGATFPSQPVSVVRSAVEREVSLTNGDSNESTLGRRPATAEKDIKHGRS